MPSAGDNTDFGSIEILGGTNENQFVINNSDATDIILSGTPRVAIGGAHPGDFVVTFQPSSPVDGGATFRIEFNPSAVGLRTATVTIPNNDADENPYNFNIQGTGTSNPEMEVSGNGVTILDDPAHVPSAGDDTDFGSVDVVTGSNSNTFTITNLGSATLNLTGNPRVTIGGANATDFILTTDAAATVAGGGGSTTTFTITFDPAPPLFGQRNATVSIANDDGDENPYNFNITGQATAASVIDVSGNGVTIANGDITPSVADDTDFGTVGIGAPGNANVFTITNSGTAPLNLPNNPRVTIGGANASDFTLTADTGVNPVPTGPGTTTFTITFTPSANGVRNATVSIANNDLSETPYVFSISGNGDENTTRLRTQRVISNFMSRRANEITASDPDLVNRLNGGENGTNGPVRFTGSGTLDNNQLAFSTSLRQIFNAGEASKAERRADLGQMMSLGQQSLLASNAGVATGFDLWLEGRWARVKSDTATSDIGIAYLGADYRFSTSLLMGMMLQLDWSDEQDKTQITATEGNGWMAGPYIAARIRRNLLFDARAAWGQSDNKVNPLGLYTDSFDTDRWLARGRLTGDFNHGNWRFSPHVGVIYFEEDQKSYTDSLGIFIPGQTVSLGRVTFGPSISRSSTREDGSAVNARIGIKGIWDFDEAPIVDVSTGLATGSTDELRGRLEGSVSLQMRNGWELSGEGFYDGIGTDDLDAWGGGIKLRMPLNRTTR